MSMIFDNTDTYDFFGMRRKAKQRPMFPFMNYSKRPVKRPQPQPAVMRFIGQPQSLGPKVPTNTKMNYWGKEFYKKESTKGKKLSKWGDADMDGSPNYFDCDPRDWLKDKKPIKKNSLSGVKEITAEEYAKRRTKPEKKGTDENTSIAQALASIARTAGKKKRLTAEQKSERARIKTEEIVSERYGKRAGLLKSAKLAEAEMAYEEAIARGKVPKKKVLKAIGEARRRQIIKMAPEEEAVELPELPYKTKTELAQMTKLKRRRYEASIGPKARARLEKKQKELIEKQRIKSKIEKEREAHARVGEIETSVKRVLTGKAALEGIKRLRVSPEAIVEKGAEVAKAVPKALRATYGKEERVATARVRRLVKGGVGGLFGAAMTQSRFGPAIRGRPGGPSGKYMIEGKPVYEEEYSKWSAEQRALNRLTPSTSQQAPLTAEQQMTEEAAPTEEAQGYPTETAPMTPEQIEASKTMETPQRGPTSEEIRMAQELAQQQDNIMNAPNILRGELKATGGSLLTPTGPQIMDAPNAFKGQLRNLTGGKDRPSVVVGERPQTNPYGDEYVDIELGSGKPVLKRRPREKWMTGEAL